MSKLWSGVTPPLAEDDENTCEEYVVYFTHTGHTVDRDDAQAARVFAAFWNDAFSVLPGEPPIAVPLRITTERLD